jgi:hypothetical protein
MVYYLTIFYQNLSSIFKYDIMKTHLKIRYATRLVMRLLFALLSIFVATSATIVPRTDVCVANNCVSFSVTAGTGCAWMCNYCANQLGTNNYYFTNGVCTYQSGGCVGNPQAGVMYTCCSA